MRPKLIFGSENFSTNVTRVVTRRFMKILDVSSEMFCCDDFKTMRTLLGT